MTNCWWQFLYIPQRKYLYVGFTKNLKRRLSQHTNGQVRSTQPHRPFQLLHIEHYSTRQEARNREKYLKSGCGKEWLKSLCSAVLDP
ncbi:endonuclease [Candidatus Peregrinibacteria bacterium CG10_big_fil_rev_8_21_14_0_10_54_7]|nr:MAG: endonuclease [Candidatus Peregrinibacteria bacterium CG10_big_fil_rev_8_21_14_0_10_54_7]